MHAAALLALLCAGALAQESTTTSTTTTAATPQAVTAASSETPRTVSLWLPMGGPEDLSIQASIVSASPDKTAYALQCKANNPDPLCRAYDPPGITITEGESTIEFTHTYFRNPEETATIVSPLTVQCTMAGARLSIGAGATSADCRIASDISGLGIIASTSQLASSEIQYMPVTITAGLEKLVAQTMTLVEEPPMTTSTAGAEGSRVTAMARMGLGGVVGVAMLANM